MDLLSFVGLLLGLATLVATQLAEGGHLGSLVQAPAAIVVGLGTLAATLLSSPSLDLRQAMRAGVSAFRVRSDRRSLLVSRYRDLAAIARKDGLVSLDHAQHALPTAFMRRAVRHVIDGCEAAQLRDVLEADARGRLLTAQSGAQVFEVAGGYAPTMGILGAVLGLVRALESLASPETLGSGIAIAFVATVYGVAAANLVLLPIAARIRTQAEQQFEEDTMVIEGTVALQAGLAPRTLERMLAAHVPARDEAR